MGDESRVVAAARKRRPGVRRTERAARAEGARPTRSWGREDSNLRRLSRRVYSPFPLAARAHPLTADGPL